MKGEHECILFIDHSFHQHSKSSDFFFNALSESRRVVRYWDGFWQGDPAVSYEDVQHENATIAVFWQSYPTIEFLWKFEGSIIVVPMFDDPVSKDVLLALVGHRATAICFSEAVECIYRRAGIDVLPIRYAPEPDEGQPLDGPINIFFWERGAVRWEDVKTLVGDQEIGKIYLKQTPDPGRTSSEISDDDREHFDLEIITDWIDKDTYEELLRKCHVYIAPRIWEGIGMSFLEAMGHGMAVIGADQPTMNEYIVHGQDGYLFEWPIQSSVDLSDTRELGDNAREKIRRMRRSYERRIEIVIDAVLKSTPRRKRRITILVAFSYRRILQFKTKLGTFRRSVRSWLRI